MKDATKASSKAAKMKTREKPLTPVLIIPGFMSSVLTVQSSSLRPSWKDQRLWLNITALGFNSIHRGGKLRRNEEIRSTRILNAEKKGRTAEAMSDSAIEEMHVQYLKAVESKNQWVEHMRLSDDMISEKKGVVVRALPGTAGVDYLSEGALTESMSYVFGPVLKLLRSVGYKDGVNLEAAPYDWRIPPSALETRDKYFTQTVATIERLYHFNENTPVVILCHSMGCKTAHYLFNFVVHNKGVHDGLQWIAKYISCYVPVGAPHIGAPASVRCMMDGDKMGLEAFLSDFEGLLLGRSLGSAPWLFPLESTDPQKASSDAPQSNKSEITPKTPQTSSMPISFLRQESSLHITIPPQRLPLESFLKDRDMYPTKLRLAIRLGKNLTMRTNYFTITQNEPFIDFNNETWIIPCPIDIEKTVREYPSIQICIEKPGAGLPKKRERGICDFDIFWPIRCALCLVKWFLCCPCALLARMGRFVSSGAMKGVNAGASALGSCVVIVDSEPVNWNDRLLGANNQSTDTEEGRGRKLNIEVKMKQCESDNGPFFWQLLFWRHPRSEKIRLNVKWEPPSMNSSMEPVPLWQKSIKFTSCDTKQLLHMEGMGRALRLMKETYEADPIGPLTSSSWHPPPVKRIISVYGINLPTETAAVYRRNPCKHIPSSNRKSESSELQPTFVLDCDALLNKQTSATHSINRGMIFETSKSPQNVITADGKTVTELKSGDGTVPYWSLQHCRMWQGQGFAKCDVTVHEIDSAEHRAILNDGRFHKILLDLLGCS
eukprot:CCRYP_016578-RB/>CCRYP_016578-RB protein AED:0.13 eAED:0.13 QI:241/1/1/1/0.75/0.66/9/1536/773